MAALNADMERHAVDQLMMSSGERLLAIGFGPGVGITYALDRVAGLTVAGIDPSQVMLKQAERRVRRAGRSADLRLGTAAQLPWADDTFDAVVAVNNIQLWQLPDDIQQVRRVLAPQGRLSIAVHGSMLARHLATSTSDEARSKLEAIVSSSGMSITQSKVAKGRTGSAIYLLAAIA